MNLLLENEIKKKSSNNIFGSDHSSALLSTIEKTHKKNSHHLRFTFVLEVFLFLRPFSYDEKKMCFCCVEKVFFLPSSIVLCFFSHQLHFHSHTTILTLSYRIWGFKKMEHKKKVFLKLFFNTKKKRTEKLPSPVFVEEKVSNF